ncbi:hypothetical protein Tco_0302402 [Tanacetum coccineum]
MRTRSQSRNLYNQQHQAPGGQQLGKLELLGKLLGGGEGGGYLLVRTMAQLLEAPTAGYEDAIVVHDHFYDEVPERPEYVGKAYAFPIYPRGSSPDLA